jgi:hypothetical protein
MSQSKEICMSQNQYCILWHFVRMYEKESLEEIHYEKDITTGIPDEDRASLLRVGYCVQ